MSRRHQVDNRRVAHPGPKGNMHWIAKSAIGSNIEVRAVVEYHGGVKSLSMGGQRTYPFPKRLCPTQGSCMRIADHVALCQVQTVMNGLHSNNPTSGALLPIGLVEVDPLRVPSP